MQGIDVLVDEHKNIMKFHNLLKKICCDVIEGTKVDVELLRECVAFGRNYADKYHHGKEEEILFKVMIEQSGDVAQKLIRNGMLVEHDLCRYYLNELDNSLNAYENNSGTEYKYDVVVNAGSYANLLKRHVEKENTVVYTFAERELSEEELNKVEKLGMERDSGEDQAAIREKYLSWLEEKSGCQAFA